MNIHDLIFATGSVVFIIALIPSILGVHKPAASSSLITGIVLTVFGFTYLTIDYAFAAATTFITALCWYILLVQRLDLDGRI